MMGLLQRERLSQVKKARDILEENLLADLIDVKDEIQLDRRFVVNELLLKYNHFSKFYERRGKFRFLTNKKVERKNKVTRDLSSSVIEKFN